MSEEMTLVDWENLWRRLTKKMGIPSDSSLMRAMEAYGEAERKGAVCVYRTAMPNDLIRLAAERAVENYGANDGTFNAAGYSQELVKFSPTTEQVDGFIVQVMLAGRIDIQPLHSNHYRLLTEYRQLSQPRQQRMKE